MLIKRKYRLLFSPNPRRRPGPKGPAKELIDAVVEMKRRNPIWGCPRIAAQIRLTFGVDIDKDMVRRILGMHFRPESGSGGPSWLTFLGHAKDSLWSADLFRCESLTLRTHWVLVVMNQFTRRIVGFGIHAGIVDGPALCQMFKQAIKGHLLPKYLSTDNDPCRVISRKDRTFRKLRPKFRNKFNQNAYVHLTECPTSTGFSKGSLNTFSR